MNQKYKIPIFLIALFVASSVYAQGVDPLRFTISPTVPGPNEQVTITVEGIGTFLGDATVTWQRDGKTELTGKGERVFSFTTGGIGVQTRVRVTVNSASQGTFARDFSFIPSSVNLIWEAKTSVPPQYRGKALYSAGSQVKVVAFPTVVSGGVTVSSNNLSFQWYRNNNPVPAQSGAGRNVFTFTGDQLKKSEGVTVDVYAGGARVGQGSIRISVSEPKVVLYPIDPLRGVLYERALPAQTSLGGTETTVKAEPYFFSTDSVPTFTWKLNGGETTGPQTSMGILTLRQAGSGAGQATLEVGVQSSGASTFIQRATTAIRIVFGV